MTFRHKTVTLFTAVGADAGSATGTTRMPSTTNRVVSGGDKVNISVIADADPTGGAAETCDFAIYGSWDGVNFEGLLPLIDETTFTAADIGPGWIAAVNSFQRFDYIRVVLVAASAGNAATTFTVRMHP